MAMGALGCVCQKLRIGESVGVVGDGGVAIGAHGKFGG